MHPNGGDTNRICPVLRVWMKNLRKIQSCEMPDYFGKNIYVKNNNKKKPIILNSQGK